MTAETVAVAWLKQSSSTITTINFFKNLFVNSLLFVIMNCTADYGLKTRQLDFTADYGLLTRQLWILHHALE